MLNKLANNASNAASKGSVVAMQGGQGTMENETHLTDSFLTEAPPVEAPSCSLIVAVIGAGHGGKAVAADLASRGKRVRLYQFPDYVKNITSLLSMDVPTLTSIGDVVCGQFRLDLVTTSMAQAIQGADVIMVVCQALSHERVAHDLVGKITPSQLLVLNPGGGFGSLVMSKIIPRSQCPVIVEISELPYGCRATNEIVHIKIKTPQLYGTLPSSARHHVHGLLNDMFELHPAVHIGQVALWNSNPIIHPAIMLLNVGRIERQDVEGPMLFYKQGVTPSVAKMIEAVDNEVMALMRALKVPEESIIPDPVDCVACGWAQFPSYYECYAFGEKFSASPAPLTLDFRYLNEDCGFGLSMYCSLGSLLGVPTPACQVLVRLASFLLGKDFLVDPNHSRNLMTMGLSDLSIPEFLRLLESGY